MSRETRCRVPEVAGFRVEHSIGIGRTAMQGFLETIHPPIWHESSGFFMPGIGQQGKVQLSKLFGMYPGQQRQSTSSIGKRLWSWRLSLGTAISYLTWAIRRYPSGRGLMGPNCKAFTFLWNWQMQVCTLIRFVSAKYQLSDSRMLESEISYDQYHPLEQQKGSSSMYSTRLFLEL